MKRIVLAVVLVVLGVLVGRVTARLQNPTQSHTQNRHQVEDFSRFVSRVDSDEVSEATFVAGGQVDYVTRRFERFETLLPPGAAHWLTKMLIERGVNVKATPGAAQ